MAKVKLRFYYHDPGCILVINTQGKMRKLYTPFRVLCVEPVSDRLRKGAWVFVDEVRSTPEDELLFVVGNEVYSYRHFQIIIQF